MTSSVVRCLECDEDTGRFEAQLRKIAKTYEPGKEIKVRRASLGPRGSRPPPAPAEDGWQAVVLKTSRPSALQTPAKMYAAAIDTMCHSGPRTAANNVCSCGSLPDHLVGAREQLVHQHRPAYTAPMTEQPSAGAPKASLADPNAECPHCLKPQALCVCEGIARINNEVSLLILQHPQDASQCESKSSLVP
jgi:hypothetical protein